MMDELTAKMKELEQEVLAARASRDHYLESLRWLVMRLVMFELPLEQVRTLVGWVTDDLEGRSVGIQPAQEVVRLATFVLEPVMALNDERQRKVICPRP